MNAINLSGWQLLILVQNCIENTVLWIALCGRTWGLSLPNSQVQSVVEQLKHKVVSRVSYKLKRARWEEEKGRKPIEMWTHMASVVAGTLEEPISTAFSQVLHRWWVLIGKIVFVIVVSLVPVGVFSKDSAKTWHTTTFCCLSRNTHFSLLWLSLEVTSENFLCLTLPCFSDADSLIHRASHPKERGPSSDPQTAHRQR